MTDKITKKYEKRLNKLMDDPKWGPLLKSITDTTPVSLKKVKKVKE